MANLLNVCKIATPPPSIPPQHPPYQEPSSRLHPLRPPSRLLTPPHRRSLARDQRTVDEHDVCRCRLRDGDVQCACIHACNVQIQCPRSAHVMRMRCPCSAHMQCLHLVKVKALEGAARHSPVAAQLAPLAQLRDGRTLCVLRQDQSVLSTCGVRVVGVGEGGQAACVVGWVVGRGWLRGERRARRARRAMGHAI